MSDSFNSAPPNNAMLCLDNNISNCKLSCPPKFADTVNALDSSGNNTGSSICMGETIGGTYVPYCKNGQPNDQNTNTSVYVKSCGNIIPLRSIDCKQYCAN